MTRSIRVKSIPYDSAAFVAGLRPGDEILEVNGSPVRDELDFRFHTSCEYAVVTLSRRGRTGLVEIHREPGSRLDVHFFAQPVRRCRNKCIFCFIDQLPRGLRKSLYTKDEDIDHSFANGNYVTLSSTSKDELQRIAAYGISPLYISVHATDLLVRRQLLGNPRAPDILPQLRYLENNAIHFHTQIVVCPGLNDGPVLRETLRDLLRFRTGLLSVALVPVGLTRFHRNGLVPVDSKQAAAICALARDLGEKDLARQGFRRVYVADELLLKANLPIPSASHYRDYPQIENGVGLSRAFLTEWTTVKKALASAKQRVRPRRVTIVTGELAAPLLRTTAKQLMKHLPGLMLDVVPVENRFLGTTVTVAGLLCAKDIIRTLRHYHSSIDAAIVPGVIFNTRGNTLDGYSLTRLALAARRPILRADSVSDLVKICTGKMHS